MDSSNVSMIVNEIKETSIKAALPLPYSSPRCNIINELLFDLRATPGGNEISTHLLVSLDEINHPEFSYNPFTGAPYSREEYSYSSSPEPYTNTTPSPSEKYSRGNKSLSEDEIASLQDFVFSNITDVELAGLPKLIKHRMISQGKFPNLTSLALTMRRCDYDQLSAILESVRIGSIQRLQKSAQQGDKIGTDSGDSNSCDKQDVNNNNNSSVPPARSNPSKSHVPNPQLSRSTRESSTVTRRGGVGGEETVDSLFFFSEYLPKMTQLTTLQISFGFAPRTDTQWNPFSFITSNNVFPALEHLVIHNPSGSMDIDAVFDTLFKHWTFPNLKTIKPPKDFHNTTNRNHLKRFFNLLISMPKLTNFLSPAQSPSTEFFEELLIASTLEPTSSSINTTDTTNTSDITNTTSNTQPRSLLSMIDFLSLPSTIARSTRNRIFQSPHLKSIPLVDLSTTFTDVDDFNEVSEWLFKMDWVKSVTSLTLNHSCPLSPQSATNIASSPNLSNLKRLSIYFHSSGDYSDDKNHQRAIEILLKSKYFFNLKSLGVAYPTIPQVSSITTSPYLSALEDLLVYEPPLCYLSSLAKSTSLTNLKKIDVRWGSLYTYSDRTPLDLTAGLVELFQSPVIRHVTTQPSLQSGTMPYEAIIALVSSPYVSNMRDLCIKAPRDGRDSDEEDDNRYNDNDDDDDGDDNAVANDNHRHDDDDDDDDDDIVVKAPMDNKLKMIQWKKLFFSNPAWSNLTDIRFYNCDINENDIKSLAESPYITKLSSLLVEGNADLSETALSYFEHSPNLMNCKFTGPI